MLSSLLLQAGPASDLTSHCDLPFHSTFQRAIRAGAGVGRGAVWLEQAVCDGIKYVTRGVGLGTLRMAQLSNGQEVVVRSQARDPPGKSWVIQASSEAGRKGIPNAETGSGARAHTRHTSCCRGQSAASTPTFKATWQGEMSLDGSM